MGVLFASEWWTVIVCVSKYRGEKNSIHLCGYVTVHDVSTTKRSQFLRSLVHDLIWLEIREKLGRKEKELDKAKIIRNNKKNTKAPLARVQ